MTAPRPGSPRWSVLLRVGAGVLVFGLLVELYAYGGSPVGLVLLAVGVACLLSALVFYLQDRAAARRARDAPPPSPRTP